MRLVGTSKRHLADPSLAAAALAVTPARLLEARSNYRGSCSSPWWSTTPRLRAAAPRHGSVRFGSVRFYQDDKGWEVDAIVEAASGRWIAVEAKLEHQRVDEGARNLLSLRNKLTAEVNEACDALIVVVADSAATSGQMV